MIGSSVWFDKNWRLGREGTSSRSPWSGSGVIILQYYFPHAPGRHSRKRWLDRWGRMDSCVSVWASSKAQLCTTGLRSPPTRTSTALPVTQQSLNSEDERTHFSWERLLRRYCLRFPCSCNFASSFLFPFTLFPRLSRHQSEFLEALIVLCQIHPS